MGKLAGDHVQVLVGGYELTGDSNKININDSFKMLDATAFSDAVQKFMHGPRQYKVQHSGYLNSALAQSHPVLKGAAAQGILSVLIGNNATPAAGDPVYSISTIQGKYSTMPEIGKVVPFNADFSKRAGSLDGWGVILGVPTNISSSTQGSGVNNGASTANGGAAYLHVLTPTAGNTFTIIVEGASNSGFTGATTLGTFTLNGTQIGSERIALSGTIPQYVRWRATASASGQTARIAVSLVRF